MSNTSGIRERTGSNLANSWRYCVAFEICAFTLHCFIEAMFILSEMRRRQSNTMLVFTLSVLLASVTSSVETYVSILYLLTASRINSFYRCLYARLKKILCNCHRTGDAVSGELGKPHRHVSNFMRFLLLMISLWCGIWFFSRSFVSSRNFIRRAEFLRILHTDLSDVCDRLHHWFGLSFICIFSVLIVRTLLIFYKITISTGKVSVINDVGSLTQIFGYLYVLTSTSQKLANSVSNFSNLLKVRSVDVPTYANVSLLYWQ